MTRSDVHGNVIVVRALRESICYRLALLLPEIVATAQRGADMGAVPCII